MTEGQCDSRWTQEVLKMAEGHLEEVSSA